VNNKSTLNRLGALSSSELLEHTTWLRSFAAALVRDGHEAEDLVQDAFGVLATTQSEVRDVRSFLAGTIRFLAFKGGRKSARRREREAVIAAEASHVAGPPDDVAERMDMMRIVLEEVRELPPLQARTLGLRFFDELDAKQIGAMEGVSASTVRANLSRGLQALRERMDKRLGSRGNWSMVIAPWALRIPLGAPPVSSAPAPAAAPAAAPATGGTAAALLTTGTILMSLKVAGLIVLPLLAVSLWKSLDTDPVAAELAEVIEADDAEGDIALAQATLGEDALDAPDADSGSERKQVAALPEPVGPATPAAVTHAFQGRVIDAATGEPIPGVTISAWREDAAHTLHLVTDALTAEDGSFRSDEMLASDAFTQIQVRDQGYALPMVGALPSFPFEGDISVVTGPTFHFDYQGSPFRLDEEYFIEVKGPGIHASQHLIMPVRSSPSPWVRLPKPLGEVGATGPWKLRFLSNGGLSVGLASVHQAVGIQADLVLVVFEPRGALTFIMEGAQDELPDFLVIDLTSEQASFTERLNMAYDEGGLTSRGVEYLVPGTYDWSCHMASGQQSGSVYVAPEERGTVTLARADSSTLSARVLLDATSIPEADLTRFGYYVVNEADITQRFIPVPKRVPGALRGTWELELKQLPPAPWIVTVQVDEGFSVDNLLTKLRFDGEPTRVTITRQQSTTLSLSVVDGVSGEALTQAEVVFMDGMRPTRVPRNGFSSVAVPNDHGVTFFIRAPGFKLTRLPFEPGRDDKALRIPLERGWRSLVRVIDISDQSPRVGIAVSIDGSPVGHTDDSGAYWLEGDGPPDLIEIGVGDDSIALVMSPFEREGQPPGDPLTGYTFLVRASK
jgi:RNA polymerase sigma factor (sigma-70 family)